MATLNNPVFYQGGKTPAPSAVVGFENYQTRIVRYNLDLDRGESARHINVLFAEGTGNIEFGGGRFDKINEEMSFYFAISTDPDAYANASYADISRATGKAVFNLYRGSVANGDACYRVLCEAETLLFPETQYYLWVFPGFSNASGGNGVWGWVYWSECQEITVTLTGEAGLVYVAGLSGIPYVWSNGAWCQGLPKIVEGEPVVPDIPTAALMSVDDYILKDYNDYYLLAKEAT